MAAAVAVYVAQPIRSLVPALRAPGGPGALSCVGKVVQPTLDEEI